MRWTLFRNANSSVKRSLGNKGSLLWKTVKSKQIESIKSNVLKLKWKYNTIRYHFLDVYKDMKSGCTLSNIPSPPCFIRFDHVTNYI